MTIHLMYETLRNLISLNSGIILVIALEMSDLLLYNVIFKPLIKWCKYCLLEKHY